MLYKSILLFFVGFYSLSFAQTQEETVPTLNAAKPLEFSIPTSAAFDLLGVTPAQVTKPGNIRDFKVDWSFQSWRLKPNIAIQAQPIWELFYNRSDLLKYQAAPKLLKMLSTLDVSAGTVEDEQLNRRLAGALKMTLFRSHDPLDEPDLFRESTEQFYEQHAQLKTVLTQLEDSLKQLPKSPEYVDTRLKILEELENNQVKINELEKNHKDRMTQLSTFYLKEHWNASFLDVAIGKSYLYKNEGLDTLRLTQDGLSVWVNGCVGLGRKWLLTGMARYTKFNAPRTKLTKEYFVGLNLRYGSPKFNFFVEVLTRDVSNPFSFKTVTVAYGGDWRFSRNVMLSYGVRTVYGEDFRFKSLIPVASISCMMR
ncbi:hypothetical protein [Runella salmonicolor]|uniref:DUF3078 domain-containing protein n=1 Tax=Runella salmonicolor TaxID=2950278 RepID=A0ABT1FRV9_9BACT|nr:hypothetical protein [Runella salmonicolor]MCP1384499.1 hypothetical protein [Runella salmonicolor]